MAIYEFQCQKCGYIFEEVCKISSTKISTFCPICEKRGESAIATKIMSSGSFRVKGFNASNGYSEKR